MIDPEHKRIHALIFNRDKNSDFFFSPELFALLKMQVGSNIICKAGCYVCNECMSSHLDNEMLSTVQKSPGLADVHVGIEKKKSACVDYESCYNVGHCESTPLPLTLLC